MPVAFVLAEADVENIDPILEKIREIDSIEEAYTVAGKKDIIIKAQAEDFREVAEAVTEDLHKIDGITDTETYFAFE